MKTATPATGMNPWRDRCARIACTLSGTVALSYINTSSFSYEPVRSFQRVA